MKKLFENLYNKLSKSGEIFTLDPVYIQEQRIIAKYLYQRQRKLCKRAKNVYKAYIK